MSRLFLIGATAWALLAGATSAATGMEREAADLEQLIAKVRSVVPDGWQCEFSIGELYLRTVRPAI
jgi:hypothetical protein